MTKAKTLLVSLTLFLSLATFQAQANPVLQESDHGLNQTLNQEIDRVLTTHISGEYNVGIIAGVMKQGQQQVWSQGSVELGRNITPDEKTIFEIGSISKVFTGILLAELVLDGTVALDDPISKFIPELQTKPTGKITLLELSTHTSGLPRLPTNISPANRLDPYADYGQEQLLEFLLNHPLENHPTAFDWKNYSNVGVGLLGYVLTKAAGQSYEQLLATRITRPLGMDDTVVSLSDEQKNRFAKPYNGVLEEVLPWDFNVLVGAGGIRSTMSDLFKFLEANLNPEESPLTEALYLAQQVHQTNGKDSIGLGWGIDKAGNFVLIGHSGGTGGFVSYLGFNSQKNVGLISLTNTSSQLKCLGTLVFWESECTPNFGHPVSESVLQTYVGTYKDQNGIEMIISRKKTYLIYEIVGQEKNRMEALSETEFDIMGIATVTFEKNRSDRASRFELKQGNYLGKFERIAY